MIIREHRTLFFVEIEYDEWLNILNDSNEEDKSKPRIRFTSWAAHNHNRNYELAKDICLKAGFDGVHWCGLYHPVTDKITMIAYRESKRNS